MKFYSFFLTSLLAGFITTLTGCSSHFTDPPRVALSDLQLTDITVFETTLQVKLRVTNRSTKPLEIRGGRFELAVNGLELGEGLSKDSVTVPGLDSREISAAFQLSNLSFVRRIQRLAEATRFEYSITGKLFGPGWWNYRIEEKNLVWESVPGNRRPYAEGYGTL